MPEYLDRRFLLAAATAGVVASIAVSLLAYLGQLKNRQAEIQQQQKDLSALVTEIEGVRSSTRNLAEQVVPSVEERVERLSSEEVDRRLTEADRRVADIEASLASLTALINPTTADEILTVARMKQEIGARERFEAEAREQLVDFSSRIGNAERRVDTLLYWIWGTLLSLLGGLLGAIIFLGGRLGRILTHVSSEGSIERGGS